MLGGVNWGGEIQRHEDYLRTHQSSADPELVEVGEVKRSRRIFRGHVLGRIKRTF